MIKKRADLYYVFNHTGKKKLSEGYRKREDAVKRLRQIEYFKHSK